MKMTVVVFMSDISGTPESLLIVNRQEGRAMCNLKSIKEPNAELAHFVARWKAYERESWIERVYVTRVYGLAAALPDRYRDVEDGAISGYGQVVEGQCTLAGMEAIAEHGMMPFQTFVRYKVMLGDEEDLNTSITPKRLAAFFFLIGPKPDEDLYGSMFGAGYGRRRIQMLRAIRQAIPTAVRAIPHDWDDGGKTYAGLWRHNEVHWVLNASVDNHAEAVALLESLTQVPYVRLPFVMVEEPLPLE